MDIAVIILYLTLGFIVVFHLALVYFWREYYLLIHRNIFFVTGLVFSRSVTETAVISVFVTYFTSYGGDLMISAVLSNTQDALSSFLVIIMANVADLFFGRYRTLVFCNTAYIGGLLLLYIFNPYNVIWLIVITLVLLSLGTSATRLLDDALVDLVKKIDNSVVPEQSEARADFWSCMAKVTGMISATLTEGLLQSWKITFLIGIACMSPALLYFVIGYIYNVYPKDKLSTERPLMIFYRVCRDGMKKLVKSDSSRPVTEASSDTTTTGEDWAKVKRLLILFPVWVAFFVVALISATGSTFFIEQYSNLSTSKKIPVQIYFLIQKVSGFAIPYVYRWASGSRKNEKVKIGVAMLCSVICCVIAWQLEVHRLKEVGKLVDQDANTSISFLWLVPQFLVLGCMEGLAEDGLLKFFSNKDLKSYGEEYIEMVMGIGKMFTIILILIFRSRLGWFSSTINESQLDKYYRLLVYLCSANFAYYCVIAIFWL